MEEIVHQYIIATPLVGNSCVMEITTPTALALLTLVITVSFTMEVYLMTRSKYCLAFESFFKMLAHPNKETRHQSRDKRTPFKDLRTTLSFFSFLLNNTPVPDYIFKPSYTQKSP